MYVQENSVMRDKLRSISIQNGTHHSIVRLCVCGIMATNSRCAVAANGAVCAFGTSHCEKKKKPLLRLFCFYERVAASAVSIGRGPHSTPQWKSYNSRYLHVMLHSFRTSLGSQLTTPIVLGCCFTAGVGFDGSSIC